ncbi:SNARE associated protein [Caldithrix abyssi DSM 13497]|uniref:Membrane protein DedA, SNARE-associated domain n=1 Tax=Caldithrix abyssi DSM 13497 TaxID=880073 RepID=H1XP89_CALAY|nr:DedA family protein [Caldithrix abyssi]APF18176.1 membrane protein DedA, SNARE-associated domain [Caldithrix abyssi DSM 13497]EHO42204.1 SNARE associated protein [Caldithrix abyssi DSM 13497]
MLESLSEFFNQLNPWLAYTLLFVSAFVENVFPPIPGDTVTVIGAYLVSTGKLHFWGVYVSTTLGSVVGFFTMYVIGLRVGTRILESKLLQRFFSVEKSDKVKAWFAKYGYWVIAANRFLSGTRSVISLFAGFFALRWLPVVLLSLLSAAVWNGLLIYGGYLLGVNWEKIVYLIHQYNKFVLIISVLVIILVILLRVVRRRKNVKSIEGKLND